MLRLAGFQSDVVREIITEQMIWGISESNLQGIAGRLEGMYQNLADKKHEYTWDEFGEFLLDECLLYFGTQLSETDWKKCGMPEQYQDIYEMCLAYVADFALEEDSVYDAEKEAKALCKSIFYLPNLEYSKGHENVLFWDGDFLCCRGWNAMTGTAKEHRNTVCTLDGEFVYE